MKIQHIEHTHQVPVKMILEKDQGVLLITDSDSRTSCIHFNSKNISEVTSLIPKKVLEVKYVGEMNLFKQILGHRSDLKNSIKIKLYIGDTLEIWFYPDVGKLRLPANFKPKGLKAEAIAKKRVLIIDDSFVIQKLLSKIIGESNNLEVMGCAKCPSEAKAMIEKNPPDLITLDIYMPEMTGVAFLKTYLKFKNIPVMLISSISLSEGPLVMEALSNGAYTFIQKPSLEEISEVGPQILEKLESIVLMRNIKNKAVVKSNLRFDSTAGLIAIGSSTGGTQALEALFTALPSDIPPIVVVQHIPAVFSKALAERLNELCPFTVKEASDGDVLSPNTIYIAPGGKQMKVSHSGSSRKICLNDDPHVNRFRPSVDYLFNSLVGLHDKQLLAVILTGMGNDGAAGMLNLFKDGIYTIAQDEASCVVYGMPREAVELGGVTKVLPLDKIVDGLITEHNRLAKKKKAS